MEFIFKDTISEVSKMYIGKYCKKRCEYYNSLLEVNSEKYNEFYSRVTKNITKKEYGSKGDVIHRGYYCPSPVQDIVIGNSKRGKLTKNRKRVLSTGYEYGFDKNNRLICVRCIETSSIEFIEYKENYSIGYEFDISESKPQIQSINECFFDDLGRIILYINAFRQIDKFKELQYEQFEYSEFGICIDYFVNYIYGIVSYKGYVFHHNKDGYLSSFDIVSLNDKSKENETYSIRIKRKV